MIVAPTFMLLIKYVLIYLEENQPITCISDAQKQIMAIDETDYCAGLVDILAVNRLDIP